MKESIWIEKRAEYNRILAHGSNVIKVCQKTAGLRNAYRVIDLAKMECMKENPN